MSSGVRTNEQLASLVGPYAEAVDAGLGEYLGQAGGPHRLAEAMRYVVLAPGKRIRPVLVLMCNEACGGDGQAALVAACAVELIHAYSLVHDDLPGMDDDDTRRGRPTCHKVYGEAMAILAGDGLLTEAFGLIARKIDSAGLAAKLVKELADAAGASGMVGGQAVDMLTEGRGGDAQMLEYIHSNKTGKLILASCRMGALTGRASEEELEAVSGYGKAVGLAFQVIDDLLDFGGDAKQMGKAVGKDHQAGKLTYPSIVGADEARQKVHRLEAEAAEAMRPLGKRADKLLLLAEMLGQRVR